MTTAKATSPMTLRMTRMAIPMPFQFLWLGTAATSSCNGSLVSLKPVSIRAEMPAMPKALALLPLHNQSRNERFCWRRTTAEWEFSQDSRGRCSHYSRGMKHSPLCRAVVNHWRSSTEQRPFAESLEVGSEPSLLKIRILPFFFQDLHWATRKRTRRRSWGFLHYNRHKKYYEAVHHCTLGI